MLSRSPFPPLCAEDGKFHEGSSIAAEPDFFKLLLRTETGAAPERSPDMADYPPAFLFPLLPPFAVVPGKRKKALRP